MSDSKLRTQSMDFAVSIINLVKYLKEKLESIISKLAEAAHPSVLISVNRSMLTARWTLSQNSDCTQRSK